MATIQNFRDLIVWQKGMDLAERVYRVTRRFPLQTHLELARRLTLVAEGDFGAILELANEVGRLLHGLWRALSPITVCYSCLLFLFGLGPGLWP